MFRWLLAFAVAVPLLLAGSVSARASCAAPPNLTAQLSSAEVAFVGTVVATADGGGLARVKVESIWRGPAQPVYLDVSGSPVAGSNAVSSVDRHYQVGVRYLFVPVAAQRPLQDNSCTPTRPYSASLAAYAPKDARAPDPALTSDPPLPGIDWLAIAVIAGASLLGLAALSLVLVRRLRPLPAALATRAVRRIRGQP
jgi:hypothetical protein